MIKESGLDYGGCMTLKPIERSAAKQSGGKPSAQDHTLIVIDDIGNLSKTVKGKGDRIFGFGVSVLKDPDKYAAAHSAYKAKKGITGEFKAKKIDSVRDKIAIGLKIRLSAKSIGYYIDKMMDTPKGWEEQGGADAQVGTLYRVIDLTLSNIKSKNVDVVVDDHSAYNTEEKQDRVGAMSEPLSKKHGKNVTCVSEYKKRDPHSAHLQTADAVSHAIFERKEEDDPWLSLAMGQRFRRLNGDDDININK